MKNIDHFKVNRFGKFLIFSGFFLLLISISKKLLPPPKGTLCFVIMNLGTFIMAAFCSGLTVHLFRGKIIYLLLIITWICAIGLLTI